MTTSTHTTDPVTPPPPPDSVFTRLVGLRKMFGQLAEFSRSHHGQDLTTEGFDAEVGFLSDELEHRFRDQWEQLWPEIVIGEAAMLHDPDTRPVLACGLCQLQRRDQLTRRAAQRRTSPTTGTGTGTSPSTSTSAGTGVSKRPSASPRTAGRSGPDKGAARGQLGQVA